MSDDPTERVAARCREVATRRRELDPAVVAEASTAVAERVLELAADWSAGAVGAYFATDGEVDPAPAVAALRARGWTAWYPVPAEPSAPSTSGAAAPSTSGAMTFRRWDEVEPPPPGRFGIPTPPAGAAHAEPLSLDVVLVPLVLFGPAGARAGRGGGHYDRTFAALAGVETPRWGRPLLVGLAHDFQRDDELVSRSHDVALDAVITPGGVLRR